MSLYNALFGVDKMAAVYLKILGIDQVEMPDAPWQLTSVNNGKRYFDYGERVYEYGTPDSEAVWDEFKKKLLDIKYFPSGRFRDISLNETGEKIILYTRNGGGNRPYYQWVFDLLRKHPQYESDYDDDYDSTYAYIRFSVPAEYSEFCKMIASGEKPETIGNKFVDLISRLK